MDPNEWVQPVLVAPTGSHLGVIEAAASASVATLAAHWQDPAWGLWLSGAFAKTVRRAQPAVLARAEALGGVRHTSADGATAVALPPSRYCHLPPFVAKAQVQGLVRDEPIPTGWPDTGMWVCLRSDLGMTTGKAAAQAAHALMAAALDEAGLEPAGLRTVAAQASFAWVTRDTFDDLAASTDSVSVLAAVTDAGRTEIPAGTQTAVAVRVL